MAKIFGQLEKAQLENVTSDTASEPKGMMKYRTDLNVAKVSNGTLYKELIDHDTAQTLSTKTFISPLITHISTPSAPAAGKSALYFKTDGLLYTLDSSGNEILVGSGGGSGGVKNYISKGSIQSNNTNGFSLFTTTMTGVNPTGTLTLSAASITTFAATATNPLAGPYSLNAASSGAWSAGQGIITDAYTIDREDLGAVQTFSFFDEIVSGLSNLSLTGTTTNTFAVWIYDVTNSAWVQPSSCYGLTGSGKVTGTVQLPTTCLSFRLAILCANASAGAVSLNFDDFSFGPQQTFRGPAIIDPVPYTPTITGFGTVSGINFKSWRDAKYLYFEGNFTAGTPTAVEAQVTLGFNGGNANVTTVSTLPTTSVCGQWARGAATTNVPILLQEPSKNYVTFAVQTGAFTGLSKRNGNDIVGAGEIVSINGKVEIQGWSSSTLMSSDAPYINATFKGTQSSQAVTANVTNIAFTTVTDKAGAWNGTQYEVKSAGDYIVAPSFVVNIGGVTGVIFLDGVATPVLLSTAGSSGQVTAGVGILENLRVGQLISVRSNSSVTVTSGQLGISKLANPQQIAASDSVSLVATRITSNQTIASAAATTLIWNSALKDNLGILNTTTGVATVPAPGDYYTQVLAYFTGCANEVFTISIRKNGNIVASYFDTPTNTDWCFRIEDKIPNCLTGDTIDVIIDSTADTSYSLVFGVTAKFSITRV